MTAISLCFFTSMTLLSPMNASFPSLVIEIQLCTTPAVGLIILDAL
jgi:hypothetical protein